MQNLTFVGIRRNARPLFGCLAIVTAMALSSATIVRPTAAAGSTTSTSESKNESVQRPEATFPGTGTGDIPDGGGGTPPQYGAPRVISFAVSGVTAPITDVSVNVTLTHTWCGDVDMVLESPGGLQSMVTVGHIGVTAGGNFGDSSNYGGTYNFSDAAPPPNIWTVATAAGCSDTCTITPGAYRTTVRGMVGTTNPPAQTSLNSTFGGLTTGQANGTWTLTIRDGANGDTGTVTAANLSITGGVTLQKAPLDFDGDGKTDYAVVRDMGGTLNWYIQRSALGFTGTAFGSTNDALVPGDYDGDLKWDIAVWRAGTFYILQSMTGTLRVTPFGAVGDDPRVTQDYDGDGKADPAVTRSVGGALTFYILRSTLGFTSATFGIAVTDTGIRGDWDGDGKADVAVYRTSAPGTFYVLRSSDGGVQSATFGTFFTDFVLPVDFDGDGKTDYAVWRGVGAGTTGTWYWLQSSDGGFRALNFGVGGVTGIRDNPVPGDYDGDGKTDQAVWRPAAPSTFYVNRSMLGFVGFGFGISTDVQPAFTLQAR